MKNMLSVPIDLDEYIKEFSPGQESEDEVKARDTDVSECHRILKNVKLRECMVPRTEIQAWKSMTA